MEPAKIDWKRIESVYVEDSVYENINAPKWVDFLAIEDENSVDAESWFCRPADCRHPKTADDFLKTPPTSKFLRSIERLPFGDRNQRDAGFKRTGRQSQSSFSSNDTKFNEDTENQNPNSATPRNQVESMKTAIKSSSEKNKLINETSQNDEVLPRIKSTLSTRNLLAGKDILSRISEFCIELKKLATQSREGECVEKLNEKNSQLGGKKEVLNEKYPEVLDQLDGREKERKPLLEKEKENSQVLMERVSAKDKPRRKKRFDETENIPVSPNLKNVRKKGEDRVLGIRTNPPSPQCFSTIHTAAKTIPSKSSTYRSMERKILQELEQSKEATKGTPAEKGISASIVEGREARALDVFWFLKPCALSG